MELNIPSIAQSYVDQNLPGRRVVAPALRLFDEPLCRAVGKWFERATVNATDPAVRRLYDQFKVETRAQYDAIVEAGIRVEPWIHQDRPQPYATSEELRSSVLETGKLFVYLTADGHGSCAGCRDNHPMREPTEVEVAGVQLCHNDLFRAVHDIFGHVLHGRGHSFAPRGEFKATYNHVQMYSEPVWPVLTGETVAQICWFFYGPHLKGHNDPPPEKRPYPAQKPLPLPPLYLWRYMSLFG